MIQIELYRGFQKLKNSTKRPGIYDPKILLSGEIKEDFSPMALEVTFDLSDPSQIPGYTYARVEAFNRYYFITNWTFVGGLWVATFVVDVLATYRDEIAEQTQYILRSESDPNPDIIDTTWMQRGGTLTQTIDTSSRSFWGWDGSTNSGCVVCGIVGNSGYNVGAVTYYAMPYTAFNAFMSSMLSSISWAGISSSEISFELQKALINPTQYIVSCFWLPFSVNLINGISVNQISLGWWFFNISSSTVKIINNPTQVIYFRTDLELPKHHQYSGGDFNKKYLNLSPYMRYTLQFFPFGVFEIDTSSVYDYWKIACEVRVSPLTGDATLEVHPVDYSNIMNSAPILVSECNIGVQLPTGQVSANIGNFSEAITAGAVAGVNDIITQVKR